MRCAATKKVKQLMEKDEITFPYTINYSIMTFWRSLWIFVLAIGLSLFFRNHLPLLILSWLVCLLGIGYYGLLYRAVKDEVKTYSVGVSTRH